MIDFLLGAAVIALPQHQVSETDFAWIHHRPTRASRELPYNVHAHMQIPVAIGSATIGLIRHFACQRTRRRGRKNTSLDVDEAGPSSVEMQWDRLSCTITTKKGGTKQILQDVSGEAKSGRYMPLTLRSGATILVPSVQSVGAKVSGRLP